jgi:tRNA (cytidine/uridine-2'-O-)-methyltransferase
MRVALYQPDIPQNAGTIIRLCGCLGVALDIIEPCGFTFNDKQLRRAAMDYGALAEVTRHRSWEYFQGQPRGRLVLLTTKASLSYGQFAFSEHDTLLLGREQAGVPEAVHQQADGRIRVPMRSGARSLNVAASAAMVLGEALRQTSGFPPQNGLEQDD